MIVNFFLLQKSHPTQGLGKLFPAGPESKYAFILSQLPISSKVV